LMALFWKKLRPAAVIAGMLFSLAGMIALSQFSWTTEVDGVTVEHRVFWPWFTLIGTILTLAVAWIVSLLVGTRPAMKQPPR